MKKREWSKSNLAVFIILGIILFIIILTIWKINDVFRPRKTEQIKIDPADLIPESEDYYCIQDVKEQEDDGVMTILVLGDDSFALERGETGLAAMISEKTGATVYNCAFEGSSFAGETKVLNYDDYPMECFSFYRLLTNLKADDYYTLELALNNLDVVPSYFEETIELMKTIDLNTVDIILVSYGINDYLSGHITTDVNDESSVGSVYGSIHSGVEIIREHFPHIKVVISSPSYAFYTEDDGELVGGDVRNTGMQTSENLGGYWGNIKSAAVSAGVTFIDNYINTGINSENASQYFDFEISSYIPNEQGRKLIAEHIADVLLNRMY